MSHKEFEKFYNANITNFFGQAYRIVRDSEAAADIVQNVMLKLYELYTGNRILLKNSRDELDAYAAAMVRNASIDYLKDISKFNLCDIENCATISDSSSADDSLINIDTLRILQSAINSLSEQQRSVLLLKQYRGLSFKEVSQLLGITEVNVRVELSRARKFIKSKLL